MIGGAPYSETVARLTEERREQRRYEIARDVMAAMCVGGEMPIGSQARIASDSVHFADALLKALEGE